MDKEYMRNYYRRMYENPCDLVIIDSEEFEEKKKIRYELEDRSHLAQSHDKEEDSGHYGRNDKSLHSVLADNTGNDYDEGSRRTSDQIVRSTEE